MTRSLSERLFYPVDMRATYAPLDNHREALQYFLDDLAAYQKVLLQIEGVDGVFFDVLVDNTPSGRMTVEAELTIEEDGFHSSTFPAKLALLGDGFMYVVASNTWVVRGIF